MYLWQLLKVLYVKQSTVVRIAVRKIASGERFYGEEIIYNDNGLDEQKIQWYYRQLEVTSIFGDDNRLSIELRETV